MLQPLVDVAGDADIEDESDDDDDEDIARSNSTTVVNNSTLSVSSSGPPVFEIPKKSSNQRADIVIHDATFTIVEIAVTNPCLSFPASQLAQESTKTRNTAEARAKCKVAKYKRNGIVDESGRRKIVPFIVEIFGRMDPVIFNNIKDLSRNVIGKGYAAAQFRMYWFQRISCALQRMHASSFKRNLAIARNEMKPGSFSIPSLVYESMGYVNSGSSFRFSGGLRARAL